MGIKLLGDERIEKQDGNINVMLKIITTSQQARLRHMGYLSGIEARIELTRYCLKNIIEKISIDEQSFNPVDLADKADLADEGTFLTMLQIGKTTFSAIFPAVEDVKK